jgi:2-methylaconitate cis-trans-isomerase PrpF
MFTLLQMHKAYAGTGTANLGPSALVAGTVVHEVARDGVGSNGSVRFGHPTGVSTISAAVEQDGDGWRPSRAIYERTARRLMEGEAFIRTSRNW